MRRPPGLVLALPSTALHEGRDGGFRQAVQFLYRYGSLVTELQFTACTGAADGRSRNARGLRSGQQGIGVIGGDDIARLILAESPAMAVAASRHFYRGADAAGHAHFGDGNGKAAVGNIMGGADAAGSNLLLHKKPVAAFGFQIDRWRRRLTGRRLS